MKATARILGITAAAALGLAAPLLAAPAAAEAHTATASITCDGWQATATAYDREATGLVVVDGQTIHSGTFDGGGQLSGVFTDDADAHTLAVTIDSTEDQYDYEYAETVTGCGPVVVPPVEPEPVDPGPQPPADEASSQSVTDEPWECDATTTWRTIVTSTSTTPYALVDGAWVPDYDATTMASSTQVIQRDLLPEELTECATPPVIVEPPTTQPEPEPVVVPEPVVEPTPEAAPVVVAPAPTQPAADAPATLPQTGGTPVPVIVLVALALALMLGGGVAWLVNRRADWRA